MARDFAPPASAPETPNYQTDITKLAAWLVSGSVLIAALYLGKDVLIPLAIAFLISFALSPLVGWLYRRGLPRALAVTLVMLIVAILVAGLGLLVASQVRVLSTQLPTYQSTIRSKIDDLAKSMKGPGILDGALRTVETVQQEVDATTTPAASTPVQRVEVAAPPASPIQTAVSWLAPMVEPLATTGIVLIFVFLALLDSGDLRDRLIRLLGGNLHRSTDALEEAGKRISRYLLMQLVVNVGYGIAIALGLLVIGVPGWILWGALAALLRFIPFIGPVLSALLPISLAFAVDPGWSMVIWTVVLFVALELISGNVVEPLLYGTSTGLSALSLIAAATFWTALWGPVGLILSTPLSVCLLVVGRNLPQLHFLDTLLGSTPVLDIPTRIYQRLLADDADEAIEIAEDVIDDDGSVTEFYNDYGIEVLKQASDDFMGNARAEHRLRVANGIDALLDNLREEYPPATEPGKPGIACIGGKWEIDSLACEMLAHSLAHAGMGALLRREGAVTPRYVEKLGLDGVDIVCLSYFSREPEVSVRTFCRRLRQRWPAVKIVLALWNAPPDLLDPAKIKALDVEAVVTSIDEAVRRMHRTLEPEKALEAQVAEIPDNDAERVAALLATDVLDGHAREELDALAKRAAEIFDVKFVVISAIDADREFIIGQSVDLPGKRTRDGTEMITMPRGEAICNHVVASGETLVVGDTERDPYFADHPAIRLWHTRFYAGSPLTTAEGHVLGALCLLDVEPRKLNEEELQLLDTMAADAVSVIMGEYVEAAEAGDEKSASSATVGQRVPR